MSKFVLQPSQFQALHSDLGANGGFTVNPSTGAPRTKGISVAPAANELRVEGGTSSPDAISSYHSNPANQARFAKGASLGGWRDPNSGADFLDTPTVYPETPGGLSRARNQMLVSNQIASYQIGKGHTLLNPFHPENKSLDVVSSDDSPAAQQTWKNMPRRITKRSL